MKQEHEVKELTDKMTREQEKINIWVVSAQEKQWEEKWNHQNYKGQKESNMRDNRQQTP